MKTTKYEGKDGELLVIKSTLIGYLIEIANVIEFPILHKNVYRLFKSR